MGYQTHGGLLEKYQDDPDGGWMRADNPKEND
jgi:hypothetical protein